MFMAKLPVEKSLGGVLGSVTPPHAERQITSANASRRIISLPRSGSAWLNHSNPPGTTGAGQKDLVHNAAHGSPHRDPTADEKTLLEQLAERIAAEHPGGEITRKQRKSQHGDSDCQAGATHAEQLTKLSPRGHGSLAEVLANGVSQDCCLVGQSSLSIEIHEQGEPGVAVNIARPRDDEVFRLWIQVLFPKRRRVDRVEQLLELGDVDLDHLALRRYGIAGGLSFDGQGCALGAARGASWLNNLPPLMRLASAKCSKPVSIRGVDHRLAMMRRYC